MVIKINLLRVRMWFHKMETNKVGIILALVLYKTDANTVQLDFNSNSEHTLVDGKGCYIFVGLNLDSRYTSASMLHLSHCCWSISGLSSINLPSKIVALSLFLVIIAIPCRLPSTHSPTWLISRFSQCPIPCTIPIFHSPSYWLPSGKR